MRDPRRPSLVRRAGVAILATSLSVPAFLGTGASFAAPSRAEVEQAKDRLMQLEREFQLVSERYNLARDRLTSLRARIASGELVVRDLERRMGKKQAAAIQLATELYKTGPGAQVEAVLSSDSLAQMDARVHYLQSSETAQARVFERLAADRSRLDAELRRLEVARAVALKTEQRLAALRAQLDQKVAAQRDEIAELNAQIERAERRAAARARAAATAAVPAPAVNVRIAPAPAPNERAQVAVDAALSQVGKPYQYGAAGPDSYDCSGLTMWSWAHAGVSLPHNSGAQYSSTRRVDRSDLQPGDLMFFGSPIHHVGMYIGNGQMVEAPYSGNSVRVNSASRSDFVGAGRPGV